MKIAFVVPGFSADENDWCIPAHTDIVRVLAHHHSVHVFTMRYPPRVNTYKIGNAIVHSFNGVGSHGVGSARLWMQVAQTIRREHRVQPFDVIHAIFGSEAGCAAMLTGKALRVPCVVWMVNGELIGLREIGYGAELSARQRWMNRLILRHADWVLCGCTMMMDAAKVKGRRTHLDLLPLGVNLQRFPPAAPSTQNPTFVNVGSLTPIKGQQTLVRAFEMVVRKLPTPHLTIAGTGPLENNLRALAQELGIAQHVTFAGNVPHDALATVYHKSDVFVQASLHEGQGMALLEAAACGCAVCGTNVGALADLAARGAAIPSPVGDAEKLADAMVYAYQRRAALGERAQSLIEREYNLESVGARLEHLYTQLHRGETAFGKHTIVRA